MGGQNEPIKYTALHIASLGVKDQHLSQSEDICNTLCWLADKMSRTFVNWYVMWLAF